jgi:predicted FMN-binding regulatory protein PaiB
MAGSSSTDHISAMYLPDHFRIEDAAQMQALMRANPFAVLVSAGPAGLYGSHLPTVLKDEGDWTGGLSGSTINNWQIRRIATMRI